MGTQDDIIAGNIRLQEISNAVDALAKTAEHNREILNKSLGSLEWIRDYMEGLERRVADLERMRAG
jgi:hypothetical protein